MSCVQYGAFSKNVSYVVAKRRRRVRPPPEEPRDGRRPHRRRVRRLGRDCRGELDASLDRGTGENHKAKLDKQALIGTILLRDEFGGFTVPLGDVNQLVSPCANCLYDDRFWKAAVRGNED